MEPDTATPPHAAAPRAALPASRVADPADLPFVTDPGERRGDMLYRRFGRSDETISAIGMGGFHLGKSAVTDDEAVRLIHEGVDRGITFMDNCWDYNEGRSELRMGVALDQGGYRDKVFLMSKMDGRTKKEAADQIDTSLKRLRTDRIDLVQHHEILRYDDPDRVFAEGGAMEAFVEAKQAGKLRYIGFTGHKDPRIHLQMLAVAAERGFQLRCRADAAQRHGRAFPLASPTSCCPTWCRTGIAVLGMKTFADSVLLKSGAPIAPLEYLHYSLNLPTSVVITGIENRRDLDQAFEAVRTFAPMDKATVAELLAAAAPTRWRASTSCSRPAPPSTAPPRTPDGSARTSTPSRPSPPSWNSPAGHPAPRRPRTGPGNAPPRAAPSRRRRPGSRPVSPGSATTARR